MSVYIAKLIKDTEAFIQAVLPVSINVVKCRWGYWGAVSSWPKKLVLFPEIDQVKFFY